MTIPIKEISETQAKEIALHALGYPPEEQDRVFTVHEGSTEDERFSCLRVQSLNECDYCWIVGIRPLDERGFQPDGPEFLVWIDQRTGNVLKFGQVRRDPKV